MTPPHNPADVLSLWELLRATRDQERSNRWLTERRAKDMIRDRYVPGWRLTDWADAECFSFRMRWEQMARMAGMPVVWCMRTGRGGLSVGTQGLTVMDFAGLLAMMTHWGVPIDAEVLIAQLAPMIPRRGGFLSLAELRVRGLAREKDRFGRILRFRADLPGIEPETVERANGYAAAIGPGGLAIKGPRIARKDWERERMATLINPRCINLPRGVVQ